MGDILFYGGLAGMGLAGLLILILLAVFRKNRKKLLKQMQEE